MKLISISKGLVVQVDDEDFEYLSKFKWQARKDTNTYYAFRKTSMKLGPIKQIFMHREILGLTDPKIKGDHKDRNGLNNQRSNLRVATNRENCCNRKPYGVSQYLGVSFVKKHNAWQAKIKFNGKDIYICQVPDEIEAAKAYDRKAIELHGEFANLNFK